MCTPNLSQHPLPQFMNPQSLHSLRSRPRDKDSHVSVNLGGGPRKPLQGAEQVGKEVMEGAQHLSRNKCEECPNLFPKPGLQEKASRMFWEARVWCSRPRTCPPQTDGNESQARGGTHKSYELRFIGRVSEFAQSTGAAVRVAVQTQAPGGR